MRTGRKGRTSRTEGPQERGGAAAGRALRAGPIRALLLEDAPEDVTILKRMVKGGAPCSMTFTVAAALSEAVELLNGAGFDLIISDLSLPDSRGLETFRKLRARAPGTPIMILTGMGDESMALQAVREGAQDYLVKGDISASALARAASYAIERNAMIQERLKLINELTRALSKVKVLSGLLPICAGCKKIRNDKGYWEQVEQYLQEHADIEFTHGFCPDCMRELYPEFSRKKGA